MLVRIHWWQRDMDALRAALERLAEAAEASELVDEERYALTQLVRLAPDEQRYLERLNLLGGLQEEAAEDFSPSLEPEGNEPQFETFAVVEDDEELAPEASVTFEEFETNAAPAPTFSDPTMSFADLNEDEAVASDLHEVDFSIVATTDAPAVPVETEPADGARHENIMRQELESVDFYIAQGYADIAVDTLEMLEKQFGPNDEIQARREKLASRDQQPAEATVFEFGGVEELPATPAPETITFADDSAYASLVGEDGGNNVRAAKPAGAGIDSGLAELFEEFRVAEEADDVREDFETHYNMGTAYKEMDLMNEAIQEFQTAVALVKPRDGTSRFLQCCNMLGHCFVQKGMPEASVLWFKKGLQAPGHSEDEYQALRYELASAYEQLGDLKQAREFYTEVYGVDVSYREVAEKLSQLRKQE